MRKLFIVVLLMFAVSGCWPQQDRADKINKSFRCMFAGECE